MTDPRTDHQLAADLARALEAQSSHRVARAFQHEAASSLRLVRHTDGTTLM